MKSIKVSIHQPEFIPYKGHFFKISNADIHIFLDDVQAERNSGEGSGWQYRNKIPTGYINVPKSKIHLGDKINEVSIPNLGTNLADWNIPMIVTISQLLGYKTKFLRSSLIDIGEYKSSTDRLVKLVQAVGGTAYIAGKGGHNYMDYSLFKEAGLDLYFVEYSDTFYYSTLYELSRLGLEGLKKSISTNGKIEKYEF